MAIRSSRLTASPRLDRRRGRVLAWPLAANGAKAVLSLAMALMVSTATSAVLAAPASAGDAGAVTTRAAADAGADSAAAPATTMAQEM